MEFSKEVKSRILFYLTIGLFSGVLLWVVESLERTYVLHNKFIQQGEGYLFSSYLVFTALGSLLWASFLLMCSITNLVTSNLTNSKSIRLGNFSISGKVKQNIIASLTLLSIFLLLRLTIHDYFTRPLYKMVAGLTDSFAYLRIIFEYKITVTVIILLVLAILLTLLTKKLETLAKLNQIASSKNSKIYFALIILATLILPISYYIDATCMVTRRDLSFHLPLYLLTLLSSFFLSTISYKYLVNNKIGKTAISLIMMLIFLLTGISIKYFHSNQNVKALFWQHSVIAKRYGQLVRKISGQRHKDYVELLGVETPEPLSNSFAEEGKTFPSLSNGLLINTVSANTIELSKKYKKRNVIFLSIDTLRADHMGIYGYYRNTTPNLDKFARQSIFCEKGYSTGTNTGHSFASILRSALGDSIFDSNIPSITDIFNQNGYKTAFITSPQTDNWLNKKRWMDYKKILMSGFQEVIHQEPRFWNAEEMTDNSIELLKRLKEDSPFFAWIHYTDPHTPYEHHPEYDFGKGNLNVYDSEIAYTDAQVGRLLKFLADSKLMEDTLIVFTSDHGEGFGEHNTVEHGTLPYVEQSFIPMWVYTPEIFNINLPMPLSHIDLGPTMLEFANISQPSSYEGRSLISIALGKLPAHPYVISETPRNIPEPTFFAWALTKDNWRLIYDKVGGCWQLYDLDKDAKEQVNLVDIETAKLNELKALLAEYLNEQAIKYNYSRWKSLKCMAKKKPKRFRKMAR